MKLLCPDCGKGSEKSKWNKDSAECELCGVQIGISCPNCNSIFTECTFGYPKELKND